MDIYEKIVRVRQEGRSAVLATVVKAAGSAPQTTGAKMLIYADGSSEGTVGGGAVEKAVLDEAKSVLAAGQAKLLSYDLGQDLAMQCGGRMTIFLEPMVPPTPLYIFGAGHIGAALAVLAKMLDFQVTVIDNRPEYASEERIPQADRIIAADYQTALQKLDFNEQTFVVIVTYRHLHDQEILEYCIRQPFKYLGMIGSKSKVAKAFKMLREKQVPEERIKRIHAPIGVDIGAETPAEIAVAIAAEMIALKRGKTK